MCHSHQLLVTKEKTERHKQKGPVRTVSLQFACPAFTAFLHIAFCKGVGRLIPVGVGEGGSPGE